MRLYPISLFRTYKSTTFFYILHGKQYKGKGKGLRKKLMNIKKNNNKLHKIYGRMSADK